MKLNREMEFGMMNSPYREIEYSFRFAKRMDLSFIDLTVEYPIPRREAIKPEQIKKLSKKYCLGLVGHTNYRAPIGHEIEAIRKAAVEEIIKTADLFRKVGIKKVNVHCDDTSKTRLGIQFVLQQHIKSLREIIRHTRKNGQILMLENGFPFYTFNWINSIMKKVPGLRIHLDIGHANLGGKKEIEKFIIRGGKFIEHIHIHDNLGEKDDHLFIGEGNINWRKVFMLLKKIKYQKTITLETFVVRKGRQFRFANNKERERYFKRQLSFLRRII